MYGSGHLGTFALCKLMQCHRDEVVVVLVTHSKQEKYTDHGEVFSASGKSAAFAELRNCIFTCPYTVLIFPTLFSPSLLHREITIAVDFSAGHAFISGFCASIPVSVAPYAPPSAKELCRCLG